MLLKYLYTGFWKNESINVSELCALIVGLLASMIFSVRAEIGPKNRT